MVTTMNRWSERVESRYALADFDWPAAHPDARGADLICRPYGDESSFRAYDEVLLRVLAEQGLTRFQLSPE
jgi:hypothetical protein